MSEKPIIATPDELIGAGIDALLQARPSASPYVQSGTYGQIFKGLRAQIVLLQRRLAAAVSSRRLTIANGNDLVQLVTSEIGSPPDLGARYAQGILYISRVGEGVHNLPVGVIPKGTQFSRTSGTGSLLPIPGCTYVSTADVSMGVNDVGVNVPVVCTVTGATGNIVPIEAPAADPNQSIVTVPTLFDKTLVCQIVFSDVSGGNSGATNGDLQRWARFASTQTNGPTLGNASAQTLISNGVARFAVLDDPYSGAGYLWVADSSWGSGPSLAARVQASLTVGLGCVVVVYPVANLLVGCQAAIVLKDAASLPASQEISTKAQAAVRAYLDGDNRDDWYNWTTDGLTSAILQSDNRIAECTPVLTNATTAGGVVIGSPVTPAVGDPRYTSNNQTKVIFPLSHMYLAGNACTFSFSSY